MIIKILYNKIYIHYLYYIVALLSILTGHFRDFVVFSILIIIHELGHVLMALYYGWNINKIVLLPFGGLTIFQEHLNKPILEEFIILIMGPIFQFIFYFLAFLIKPSYMLTNYHYAIILFNLLPIIPLDGSKLINIICNLTLPFKRSHLITIYISIIVIIGIILYNISDLLLILILLFLTLKIIKEYRNHKYIFNKFLFERTIYKFNFNKIKIIKGTKLSKMYRDHKHIFKINKIFYKEDEILRKKFDNRTDLW
ncbi:MAG: site-2 protease family protein [Bacilli bacterium]|nr:site-2 protease family protein [Bacilli bacterium]MDD4718984.1 site-2 protease family protein [Bacilli bacterium]